MPTPMTPSPQPLRRSDKTPAGPSLGAASGSPTYGGTHLEGRSEWEGRLHGSDTWEDIWPEHDGQMSYGADITYVEIRRRGFDALT